MMNIKNLERKCVNSFGQKKGDMLFQAMQQLSRKKFCVATGWEPDEVSLSYSCLIRGQIFKLTPDYKSIILPDGEIIEIKCLSYRDLLDYLPKTKFNDNYRHCFVDGERETFDVELELDN
jgi:hypothetical protein